MLMKHPLAALALTVSLCAGATARAQDAAAPPPTVYVIPPGQETVLADMFGGPALFPGLCRLERATAARAQVEIEYRCQSASAPVLLDARHPTAVADSPAVVRTAQFALVPRAPDDTPPGLIDAVAERVRAHEPEWHWMTPAGGVAPAPSPAGTDGGAAPDVLIPRGIASSRPGLSPAQEQRYQEGLGHYRAQRYPQAIETYTSLARENPCCGVLGMVVASLASTAPAPGLAARYAAEADRAPNDKLAQFVAGTVAHYAAHHSGRSREEKSRLYAQAIQYLDRTRPTFDFEPRLFIYLAVSHFRLGHQREAEEFIERAVTLGHDDPDVFYCRAEIFQRSNIQRSIEDIDTYLRMMAVFERQGAVSDPAKTARVHAMRDHLVKVSRGEASPTEIFDPIAAEQQEGTSSVTSTTTGAPRGRGASPPGTGRPKMSGGQFGMRVVGVGIGVWALWGLSRLVRKGRKRQGAQGAEPSSPSEAEKKAPVEPESDAPQATESKADQEPEKKDA